MPGIDRQGLLALGSIKRILWLLPLTADARDVFCASYTELQTSSLLEQTLRTLICQTMDLFRTTFAFQSVAAPTNHTCSLSS